MRVGTAAGLHAGMHVLDLACGYGASLQLWHHHFGVTRVAGLEVQTPCIEHLRPLASETYTVAQGRFDELPLPAALAAHSPYDAVVCVDAAYHARSLRALAAVARSALKPDGCFAFTTLATGNAKNELPPGLSWLLRAAGIGPASLLSIAGIKSTLMHEGFSQVTLEPLDDAVFAGFAAYVRRRALTLPWRERCSPDWLKIKGAGLLCGVLARQGGVHYVVVQGRAATGMLARAQGLNHP